MDSDTDKRPATTVIAQFEVRSIRSRKEGAPGLGYIIFEEGGGRGPIANNLDAERIAAIRETTGLGDGDAVFFAAGAPGDAAELAGKAGA